MMPSSAMGSSVLNSAFCKSFSVNESVARSVVAAFCAQLDPAASELADIKCAVSEAVTHCAVHAYRDTVGEIKAAEARKMEGGVVTIGNGFNDIQMSDAADLSICVMGAEGCCSALITHTDVTVTSIEAALDLLLIPGRLRATLRT